MRLLLCILAFIGLLLSPAAATAAAASCVHEDGSMMEPMAAPDRQSAADHSCCPDMAKPSPEKDRPQKHDSKACAQACATMFTVSAPLPTGEPEVLVAARGAILTPAPSQGLHPFAPPGLKRPPRSIA